MAQITTITNPLTGQPAQVDQLDHTAQEIDDAIARALPSGAIDIALQNNDPRQWGLGADSILVDSLDNALETGWYKSNVGTPGAGYWNCHAMRYNSASVTQMATQYDNSGALIAFRMLSGSTWSPWEWVNPPMILGVEYRTTERYLGKPVYVKAIDFGAAPNSTLKTVSIGTANIEKIVDFKWMFANGNDIGMIITNPNFTMVVANTGAVVIETNADMSSTMIKTVVKYIKTTD